MTGSFKTPSIQSLHQILQNHFAKDLTIEKPPIGSSDTITSHNFE